MVDKKNIILAFGNKEFNNSLNEIQEYLSFNLITLDNYKDYNSSESYQGFIIHEDAFKDKNFQNLIIYLWIKENGCWVFSQKI